MILSGDSPSLPVAQQIDGWEARFIGQEPRLSEVIEMYQEIGFEVRIESFTPDRCVSGCRTCFDESDIPHYVVYTCKINEVADDLF